MLIIISLFTSKLLAAEGCLVGSTVYYSFVGYATIDVVVLPPSITIGKKVFRNDLGYSTIPNACPGWASSITNTNVDCLYGPVTVAVNVAGLPLAVCVGCPQGKIVNFTYLNCPLDDYSWAFGASAAVLGIFVIKKRNKVW